MWGRAEKRLTENFMRGQHSDMDGINIGEEDCDMEKMVHNATNQWPEDS